MRRRAKDGWRVQDCQIAAKIFAERSNNDREGPGSAFFLIAAKLGRTEKGTRQRFYKYGANFGEDHVRRTSHYARPPGELVRPPVHQDHPIHTIYVPPDVLAERDRRLGLERTSTTAVLCGDPLPGYSALDRQRQS